MTIYSKNRTPSKIYRRIYEQCHGPIPKDEDGRTYDIHHIDGDTENNHPSNLIALSIREHYAVHKAQGDYGACWKISAKLKLTVGEFSDLARLRAVARVTNGTHPFLGGDISRRAQLKLVEEGKHHLQQKGCNHPKYDSTIYVLQNINSLEIVSGTRQELVAKLRLTDDKLSKLLCKRRRTTAGWRINP